MLYLTRKIGESIVINDDIEVTVVAIRGKSVKLGVLRGKQALTLEVKLGEAKAKGPRGKSRRTAPSNLGGVKVDDLTPELRSRLHLPDTLKGGVIVKSVESGSTAELSGIQRGDVVASVDKQPIKSVGDFERALSKHDLRPIDVAKDSQHVVLHPALLPHVERSRRVRRLHGRASQA